MTAQFESSSVEPNYFHHQVAQLEQHLADFRQLADVLRSVFKTRAVAYSCIPDEAYEGLYMLELFARRHIVELESAIADIDRAL